MNKTKSALLMAALSFASATKENLFLRGHSMREEKKESPEEIERREKCARMAIEKAKAKRERKAAKLRLSVRKEESK